EVRIAAWERFPVVTRSALPFMNTAFGGGSPMTGHAPDPDVDRRSAVGDLTAVTDEITSVFRETLHRQSSELMRHPEAAATLDQQVRSVVADVDAAIRTGQSPLETRDETRLFSISIGIDRAQRGIHPSESL